MELEILLSTLNLKKNNLDKMNISCKCTVVDQCGINEFEKYNFFNIYHRDEIGVSKSRNFGLKKVTGDIILLCDDDVVYCKNYREIVLREFENNKKADVIFFNFKTMNRKKREIKKNKRLHFYNCLNFASYNIAFRRKSVENIRFNNLFGPGSKYYSGEDSLFIVECLKKKLKIYSCSMCLGTVLNESSTWFKGYDYNYFFVKGALFTAINNVFRHFLMVQYLLRHRDVLINYNLREAYMIMLEGSKEYLNDINNN